MQNTGRDKETYKEISVSPELFRILTYFLFMVLVGVGWVLTAYFSGINFSDNPMVNAFGYNNMCVLFDFPPSTYVLPIIYAVVLLCWTAYLYTHWVRAHFLITSRTNFIIFSIITVIEFLSAVIFSIIFAVHPMDNLTIHYAGFAIFIFALTLLAFNNYFCFRKEMFHSPLTKFLGATYAVSAVIIGTIKILLAINFLILGYPWLEPLGYTFSLSREQMITIYLIVDRLWGLLFIVIPFLFSFYLYKKLPHLNFKIRKLSN